MTRASGPGWRSMQGLAWLARVGASPADTWAAAMNWGPSTLRSHTLRLERDGLLARMARAQGQGGPLLYATALGVQAAGVDAGGYRKPPAPVSFGHLVACAEMAAYLTQRGREMIAPRELMVDSRWVGQLEWTEHGETRRRGHRPDFVATVAGGRSLAIEVELTAKSPDRLRSVLALYVEWLESERVDSVLYVVGGDRERRQLVREAPNLGLEPGRRFGVQLLSEVRARLSNARENLAA